MKFIFLLTLFVLLAVCTEAQVFTVDVNQTTVTVNQTYQPTPAPFDTVAVSFTFIGEACTSYVTPKMTMATSYALGGVPTSLLEDGSVVYINFHYGTITANGVRYEQVDHPKCPALILPMAPAIDTVMQPFTVNVPQGTYEVDWLRPSEVPGGDLLEYNSKTPSDANLTGIYTVTLAGYLVSDGMPTHLPQGTYYVVALWEWQGMFFIENEFLSI